MKKPNFSQAILSLALPVLLTGFGQIALAKSVDAKPQPLSSLDAETALRELKLGNQRFLQGNVRKDGQSSEDLVRLAKGQAPNSIVLSCSDSRVPPETVFDQKLGEMFTVRSAGETLSPQAIGSIEYAVEKLGSHLVVVLGHTSCGAVKAALETIDGKSAGSSNLDQLVGDIHPRLKPKFDQKNPSKDLKSESWLNAQGVARDLLKRSVLISKAVESGKVKIQVGLYSLANGTVEFQSVDN